MKELVKAIEDLVESIGKEELKRNPKASAKTVEINKMISELKATAKQINSNHKRVLKYISPKTLLEN